MEHGQRYDYDLDITLLRELSNNFSFTIYNFTETLFPFHS